MHFEKNNSNSKECNMCRYWFFTDKNFGFQQLLCDGCHNLFMVAYKVNQVAIFNIGEYHYRCYFVNMTKDEAKKH